MPTLAHDAPLEVLREDPGLIALLLRELGVDVPVFANADVAEADFTQVVPAEFRADLVVCLRGGPPASVPLMGIVVEVQRARDERKRRTWPLYLAALHARLECPTCLVVLASDDGVAAWAARPITTLQPGVFLSPVVLGPAQVPVVDTPAAAEHPWLGVLSALVHGNGPNGLRVVLAAIEALASLPDEHATLGYDLIFAALDERQRRTLEEVMQPRKYEYQSDFARKYYGEGLREGLDALRGIVRDVATQRMGALAPQTLEQIERCGDIDALAAAVRALAVATDAASAEQAITGLPGPLTAGRSS